MSGVPIGTTIALAIMLVVPVATYLLYRIDKSRGDGRVTVVGKR